MWHVTCYNTGGGAGIFLHIADCPPSMLITSSQDVADDGHHDGHPQDGHGQGGGHGDDNY